MQFGSYKGITLLYMVLQDVDLVAVASDVLKSNTDESVRVAKNLIDEAYNLLDTGSLWTYNSSFKRKFADKRLIADLQYDEVKELVGGVLASVLTSDYQNYCRFADVNYVVEKVAQFAKSEGLQVGSGFNAVKRYVLQNMEPTVADNSTVCESYGITYSLPSKVALGSGETLEISESTGAILIRVREKFKDLQSLVVLLQNSVDSAQVYNVHSNTAFERQVLERVKDVANVGRKELQSTVDEFKSLCHYGGRSESVVDCPTVSAREAIKHIVTDFDLACDELFALGCYGLCDKSAEFYKKCFEESALTVSIADYISERLEAYLDSLAPIGEDL